MSDTLCADLADHCMRLESEIARLNHQHANDEAANQILSDACAMQQARMEASRARAIKECASLFSGGIRNRELYVNDIEEAILALLGRNEDAKPPVEPEEVYSPHTVYRRY